MFKALYNALGRASKPAPEPKETCALVDPLFLRYMSASEKAHLYKKAVIYLNPRQRHCYYLPETSLSPLGKDKLNRALLDYCKYLDQKRDLHLIKTRTIFPTRH